MLFTLTYGKTTDERTTEMLLLHDACPYPRENPNGTANPHTHTQVPVSPVDVGRYDIIIKSATVDRVILYMNFYVLPRGPPGGLI